MAKKPEKIRSFARRLTQKIVFTQCVVMGLAGYLIYDVSKDFVVMEEADLYKSYLNYSNAQVSKMLSDVSTGTVNHVPEIEESLDNPDRMAVIMKRVVEQNPLIRSCGISFVDNYYPQKGRWFCPYAYRDDDGQIKEKVIGDANSDYLNAQWFTEALAEDSAYWAKPFFEGNDSLRPQVSFLVPIHDGHGRTVAIVGADMSLNWFRGHKVGGMNYKGEYVNFYINSPGTENDTVHGDRLAWIERRWRFIYSNYIIDSDGTFIAHPDSTFVIRKNYFEQAKVTPDTLDDHIGRQMVAGEKGYYGMDSGQPQPVEFFDMEGVTTFLFYEPVPNTTWSVVLAVPSIMVNVIGIGVGTIMAVLIVLALLVGFFVGHRVIKRATKPLRLLAESANEVAKGNFSAPLPAIKHHDEIMVLRDSFEGMQHSLTQYVAELKDTTASKAAMENELKIAHDIQMSMLPKTFPPYPERTDIDIYGSLTPARAVGGDLFDFFTRDDQLFFCIGDVSGKGVPAALVMAVACSVFRNVSAYMTDPATIAMAINNVICQSNDSNMFVTIFIGQLDLASGKLSYCNAGHNAPLLMEQDGSNTLPCDPNIPAGAVEGWEFSMQERVLRPQTTLFLYTDGLNEAENSQQELFGMERVSEVAERLRGEGNTRSETIVRQMAEAVHGFVGNAEQSDEFEMKLRGIMGERRHFKTEDYNAMWIWNRMTQYLNMQNATGILTTAIWIVGLLTLISGIVGVSNIMLITVKERTHEFGIRKALGAKPRQILTLIVVESIIITAIFGYIGMVAGIGATEIVNMVVEQMGSNVFRDPTVDMKIAIEATLTLILAGTLAGFFPAKRAVSIKPIEALREQ